LLLSSDAFGKFSPYEVYEKSSGRIFTIYVSKNEAVSREIQTRFRRFQPVRNRKSFGRNFTIYVSKNEAVSYEIQMQFRSFLPASFAENVLGALSRFLRPKTKLFAVKFTHIL